MGRRFAVYRDEDELANGVDREDEGWKGVKHGFGPHETGGTASLVGWALVGEGLSVFS